MQEREDYNRLDFPRVDHRRACWAVDAAREHIEKLRDELAAVTDTTTLTAKSNQRVTALLDKSEIVLGSRLGSGGFSAVYEVQALRLDPNLDVECRLDGSQLASRKFLQERAEDVVLTSPRRSSSPLLSATDSSEERRKRRRRRRRRSSAAFLGVDYVDGLCGLVEMCSRRTTARYAVKHMRYSLAEDPVKYEKAAVDLAMEGYLLQMLDHPNIVSLWGCSRHGIDSFRGGSPSDFFLVIDCLPETLDDRFFAWRQEFRSCQAELIPLSRRSSASSSSSPYGFAASLLSSLGGGARRAEKRHEKYKERFRNLLLERLQVAHDVASGIEYLHERRVMHRDIKSSNVGFDADGVAQIFDLGLARLLPPESERLCDGYVMSRVGTRSCMAPEVADKLPYDLKADVYSFGIVLWEILSMCTAGDYFRVQKRKEQTRKSSSLSQDPNEHSSTTIPPETSLSSSAVPAPLANKEAATSVAKPASAAAAADCILPICPCWSTPLQELVAGCLSRDARLRPTMTEVRIALYRELEPDRYELASLSSSSFHPRRRRSTSRLDLSASAPPFAAGSASSVAAGAGSTTATDSMLSRDVVAAAKIVAEMMNRNGPLPGDESSTAFGSLSCATLRS
jgi:serine/threonine protein kinase